MGPTKEVAPSQVPGEFALEGSAGQHIEIIGVDGFVRDAHRRVFRILLEQPVGNLFGRPALGEQPEDRCAQVGLNRELPRLARLVRPAPRPLARELARQCTRRARQHLGGGAKALSNDEHSTQLLAFHETQTVIADHVQLLRSWMNQDTGVALGT